MHIRTLPYKKDYHYEPSHLVGSLSYKDSITESITGTSVENDLSIEQILGDIWNTIISAAGIASDVIESLFESPEASELITYGPISLPKKSSIDFEDALEDFRRILRESHMRSVDIEDELSIEKRFQKIFASIIELNDKEKDHLARSIELFQKRQTELYDERKKILKDQADLTDSAKHWDEFHYIVSALGLGASGFAINPLVGFITTAVALGVVADHLLDDPIKKGVSELLFPECTQSQKDCLQTLEGTISVLSTIATLAMAQFALLKAVSGLSEAAFQTSKLYHDSNQRKLNVDMTKKDFYINSIRKNIDTDFSNYKERLQAYYQSSKQLQDLITRQKTAARLFIGSIK